MDHEPYFSLLLHSNRFYRADLRAHPATLAEFFVDIGEFHFFPFFYGFSENDAGIRTIFDAVPATDTGLLI